MAHVAFVGVVWCDACSLELDRATAQDTSGHDQEL
jgi:hypothetical protein